MVKERSDLILENAYQVALKRKIKKLLPGCMILKNDPNDIQGIPDLQVITKKGYAMLETKASKTSKHRPNQDYYIEQFGDWALYSSFIYPENEEAVLHELQQALRD